jgi:PKD repeat protein
VLPGVAAAQFHSADSLPDNRIALNELLRCIQFYNSSGLHCDAQGEDGFAPGPGVTDCGAHSLDYNPQNWLISLTELLRLIQLYNAGSYEACESGEDGFCPVVVVVEGEPEGEPEGVAEGEGEVEGAEGEEAEGESGLPSFSRVDIAHTTGNPGQTTFVNLSLFNQNATVATMSFSILYDPAVLSYQGFVAGAIVGAANKQLTVTQNGNQLSVQLTNPGATPGGLIAGQLGTLAFGIAPGATLNNTTNLFSTGAIATKPGGNNLPFSVQSGSVRVVSATAVAPTANFVSNFDRGLPGLLVQFTDLSNLGSGTEPSYFWDFGDGNTSTEQNPAHTYTQVGNYDVSLLVITSDGQDTETKVDFIQVTAGVRRYVSQNNVSGIEDGLSWQTAYRTIQPAIDSANQAGGGEVWVAGGIYNEERENAAGTVLMRSVVNMYGGFAGVEGTLGQRNIPANPTVIDGSTALAGEPAIRVITGVDNAQLDGFIIQGGWARGANMFGSTDDGGGMFNQNASVRVYNCTFRNNRADSFGGAVYNVSGQSQFVNCVFENNRAESLGAPAAFAAGGAMANNEAEVTLSGCSFTGNSAVSLVTFTPGQDVSSRALGGAMYNFNTTLTVDGCVFANNVTDAVGQGSNVEGDITYAARPEAFGGGIYSRFGDIVVRNSTFSGNSAQASANGAFSFALGAGLYNEAARLMLTNSFVYENSTVDGRNGTGGAGVYIDNKNLPATVQAVVNNTIVENTSDSQSGTQAGGLLLINTSPRVANNIIWDNSGVGYGASGGTPTVSYSNIQVAVPGTSNLSVLPGFVSQAGGNLRLSPTSAMIDAGRDTSSTLFGEVLTDFEGNARGIAAAPLSGGDGSNYDIGADEYTP